MFTMPRTYNGLYLLVGGKWEQVLVCSNSRWNFLKHYENTEFWLLQKKNNEMQEKVYLLWFNILYLHLMLWPHHQTFGRQMQGLWEWRP